MDNLKTKRFILKILCLEVCTVNESEYSVSMQRNLEETDNGTYLLLILPATFDCEIIAIETLLENNLMLNIR